MVLTAIVALRLLCVVLGSSILLLLLRKWLILLVLVMALLLVLLVVLGLVLVLAISVHVRRVRSGRGLGNVVLHAHDMPLIGALHEICFGGSHLRLLLLNS